MAHDESMALILEKADQVATDVLKLLEEQLKELGITEPEMISALQYAIAVKMQQKVNISEIK